MRCLWMTLLLAACSSSATMGPPDLALPPQHPIAVTAEPQRSGDATAGYHALVNNGYVSCGIPYSLYSQVFGARAAAISCPAATATTRRCRTARRRSRRRAASRW